MKKGLKGLKGFAVVLREKWAVSLAWRQVKKFSGGTGGRNKVCSVAFHSFHIYGT